MSTMQGRVRQAHRPRGMIDRLPQRWGATTWIQESTVTSAATTPLMCTIISIRKMSVKKWWANRGQGPCPLPLPMVIKGASRNWVSLQASKGMAAKVPSQPTTQRIWSLKPMPREGKSINQGDASTHSYRSKLWEIIQGRGQAHKWRISLGLIHPLGWVRAIAPCKGEVMKICIWNNLMTWEHPNSTAENMKK